MAYITYYSSSNVGLDGDYKLSLSQEQIARKMDIGQNWRHIRVGIRAMVSRSGADLTSANFALGVTSGTSSLYSDADTTHFVGVGLVDTSLFLYTNFNDIYNVSGSCKFYRKTGSLYASASNGLTMAIGTTDVVSTNMYIFRTALYLDLIKSNTDPGIWTLKWFSTRTSTGANDVTLAQFYENLLAVTQSLAVLPWTGYYLTEGFLPISESVHGYLDTVNLYWQNATTTELHLSDIAVYRFR